MEAPARGLHTQCAHREKRTMNHRTTLWIPSLVSSALFTFASCVMGLEGEYNESNDYNEESGALSFSESKGMSASSNNTVSGLPAKKGFHCSPKSMRRSLTATDRTMVQSRPSRQFAAAAERLETSQRGSAATCTLQNAQGDELTISGCYSRTNKWKLNT